MGPKARPAPKPHAKSVRSKIKQGAKAAPKPWPKKRALPRSLLPQAATATSQARSSRFSTCPDRDQELEVSNELQLTSSQGAMLPREGRILSHTPRPQTTTVEMEREKQTDRVWLWLKTLKPQSITADQLCKSKHAKEHLELILNQCERATIKRFLNGFAKFAQWLTFDGTISWDKLEPYHLSDYLIDTIPRTSEWRCKPPLLALTWASRTLGLQSLSTSIQSPLIQSFFNSKSKRPLNPDLIPITLGMAHCIEKSLLDSEDQSCILPMGTFLLMFWAGLRYSDVQRVRLSSISLTSGLLRGRTWKSKNAKHGFAFACITSGLLGTHSQNWASKWFGFLKSWWSKLSEQHGVNIDPHFVLPLVHPSKGDSKPVPMAHYQAAIWLRLILSLSADFKPTLHGLKAGLISIGKQLTLPAEWLSEQGHYAPRSSTGTYTREDTFFQLRLQAAIMSQVQKGWRPILPQARGSSRPLKDLPFHCLGWLSWDWLFPEEGTIEKHIDDWKLKSFHKTRRSTIIFFIG